MAEAIGEQIDSCKGLAWRLPHLTTPWRKRNDIDAFVRYVFRMTESRINVTEDELDMAIRLWIRLTPPHIWRVDEAYERLRAEKRHDPSKAPDPKRDLAAYIVAKFRQAGWEITREPSKALGSPPPWSGDR